METYADVLRSLADELDEDFNGNREKVAKELEKILAMWNHGMGSDSLKD